MTEPLAEGLHDVPAGWLATVVTSLAMARRPTSRLEPPPGLRLAPVAAPTPGWYRPLFRRVGAPWLWSSRLLLTDAALATILRDPDVAIFAVERAGFELGFVELDFRVSSVCEIAFFGLVPEATGRGIGRWMMGEALQAAWSRPVDRIWVHTCTLDHPGALGFYRACGFTPFRQQVEVLADPRKIGLLPEDAAPQIPML